MPFEENDYPNYIIGLHDQTKFLENLLLEFKQNGKGGSCLLSGRRYTGKSLVVTKIRHRHFNDKDKETRIEEIDGREYESFAATSKIFERIGLTALVESEREFDFDGAIKPTTSLKRKDMTYKDPIKMPKILFIIDHFEHFARKNNQNFLYSILNGCQRYPWFVLLIGTSENGVSILEKRVRSRLSKIKINFNVAFTFEEFTDGFFQLAKRTSIPTKLIKELEDESKLGPEVAEILFNLYQRHNSIGWVKKLVQLFDVIYQKHTNKTYPIKLLGNCLDAILPENQSENIIDALTVRQLCLLNCAVCLEEKKYTIKITYREITSEYYRFVNEHDKTMRVHDRVLFRDLDELLSLRLLVQTKKIDNFGQLQFKKVTLNVDEEEIKNSVNKRRHLIPLPILQWFNV